MKDPAAARRRSTRFLPLVFVFGGGRLALSEVYRVIALLAPALTPVPSGVESLAAI